MRRWVDLPLDEIAEDVRDALGGVREAVTDVVATELGDLRRSIRKSRKRLGV
jgi:hypothetical protein